MYEQIDTEICIVGGGPAGSATALRLAQLGRRVCLLERTTFPRAHVGESLPPSIWPILNLLEVSNLIEGAGFLHSTGSILHWAGVFERRGAGAGRAGLLVDRGKFDALLLDAARLAGVQVLQPARAYRPVRSRHGWDLPLRLPNGTLRLHAKMLIDAAGRQAGLGRQFRRASQPMLALYAYWQAPQGFGTQTRVEAGAAHWYWAAPLPGGIVNAMVFVDPGRCTGLSAADRRDLYLNLLAQSTLLSPCLECRRIGPVRRCDATSLMEMTPPAADLLRVGEASLSVDPLSSQGVQMAMAQAVQAAVVANTVLTRPEHAELALSFYQTRQSERVRTHAALAADFYARQNIVSAADFWSDRARPMPWITQPATEPEMAPLPENVRLRLSAKASVSVAGIQTESHIAPASVVLHPALPLPVANLEGIDLAPLVRRLNGPAHVAEIIGSWSDTLHPEQSRRVLSWLWQNRILVR